MRPFRLRDAVRRTGILDSSLRCAAFGMTSVVADCVRNDRNRSYAKVSESGNDGKCHTRVRRSGRVGSGALPLVRDDDFPAFAA